MANIDAFSAQIVQLVRSMPDNAILALVKNQLGALTGDGLVVPKRRGRPPRLAIANGIAPVKAARAPKRGRPAATAKRGPGRPPKTAAHAAERRATLEKVEKLVKASSGLSASEVARDAGVAQPRVAAALKELKLAKRIYQGGDRRFARYAGDGKTAEQASLNARNSAIGPAGAKKVKPGRKKAK
jgi:DNA-binding transcriptional ArsR family regulator